MDEEVTFNRPQRNDEMRAFHAEMLRQERRRVAAARRAALRRDKEEAKAWFNSEEAKEFAAKQIAETKSVLDYVKFDLGDGSTFTAPVVSGLSEADWWKKIVASTAIVTTSSISGVYSVVFDEK